MGIVKTDEALRPSAIAHFIIIKSLPLLNDPP